MRRFSCLILVSIVFISLYAGIAPQSAKIGSVAVSIGEGSVEEMVLSAVKEDFTLFWLEKYAVSDDGFAVAYSSVLSSLLPMEEVILGTYDGEGISLYSAKDGKKVYL
ncbi:MAG: hypothetical protein ACI4S4_03410, partial [Candidatus Ornithospirochaeta sp.]